MRRPAACEELQICTLGRFEGESKNFSWLRVVNKREPDVTNTSRLTTRARYSWGNFSVTEVKEFMMGWA